MKFTEKFTALWNNEHTGDLSGMSLSVLSLQPTPPFFFEFCIHVCFSAPSFFGEDSNAIRVAQENFFSHLLHDTVGFAAAKMIRCSVSSLSLPSLFPSFPPSDILSHCRRIVGIAHVEDFESIRDQDVRAKGERAALHLAHICW